MALAMTMLFVVSSISASAQLGPIGPIQLPPLGPTTTVPPPAAGSPPPPPTTPTTAPSLLNILKPTTTTPPPPAPATTAPVRATTAPGNGGGDGEIPAGAGPFPADLARKSNSIRRSGPRNTRGVMDNVKALTDLGMPQDEALRVAFGRFPVAGTASYTHDWLFPRFGPGWRLHQGTDIFAVAGTPVRSPTDGVVRLSDGGLGGISVYVVQDDGTYFYMAHLAGRAKGLSEGQAVRTGDVVGYVGSTGNASGGSPHLHFEVHPVPPKIISKGKGKNRTVTVVPQRVRPGTVLEAVDPKGYLDQSLQDALDAAPGVVTTYEATRAIPAAAEPAPAPFSVIAGLGGGLPNTLASVASPRSVASEMARVPLFAVAFLMLLLVAVLTPVFAPRRHAVAAGPAGPANIAGSAVNPARPEPSAAATPRSRRGLGQRLRRKAREPAT